MNNIATQGGTNKSYGKSIVIYVLLLTIISSLSIWKFGTEESGVRILIRYSARLSALLFCLAFGISSIHFLIKKQQTAWLLTHRPYIGLGFAVMHTFHLGFLIWLQQCIHPVFSLAQKTSLIAGGMAYLLMHLMVFTTFPYIKHKMSLKLWRILHLVGGYWIWFIFFNSYFKRVLNLNENYFMFFILVSTLLLRIIHLLLKRRYQKPNPNILRM